MRAKPGKDDDVWKPGLKKIKKKDKRGSHFGGVKTLTIQTKGFSTKS